MSNLMSGARILLECLTRENVDVIFGYPGGVTLPLYDAMYDHPIRHGLRQRTDQHKGEARVHLGVTRDLWPWMLNINNCAGWRNDVDRAVTTFIFGDRWVGQLEERIENCRRG